MSESQCNQDKFELLDAALRREVIPEEPLREELAYRIVESIRGESRRRVRWIAIRRFAIGAAAACVLLAIGLLVNNDPVVDSGGVGPGDPESPGQELLSSLQIVPVIVDDSLAAVEELAGDSMAQEMRDLASDASEIGSGILASLPSGVGEGRLSRLLSGFVDK